jgi:hypothetical protein
MSDSLLAVPRPAIPAEVQDFAAEKGLSRFLKATIDLAQQAFSSSALQVSLGQDAEDETQRYVAIDVDVSGLSTDELLSGQRIWSAGVSRACPSRYAVYFVLGWR